MEVNVKAEVFSNLDCELDDAKSVLTTTSNASFRPSGLFHQPLNAPKKELLKQHVQNQTGSLSLRFSEVDF